MTQKKTLEDFQTILSNEIDRIVAGKTTAANANAVVNLTAAFLRTIKMQMDYAKQIGRTPNIPLLLTAGMTDLQPEALARTATATGRSASA